MTNDFAANIFTPCCSVASKYMMEWRCLAWSGGVHKVVLGQDLLQVMKGALE